MRTTRMLRLAFPLDLLLAACQPVGNEQETQPTPMVMLGNESSDLPETETTEATPVANDEVTPAAAHPVAESLTELGGRIEWVDGALPEMAQPLLFLHDGDLAVWHVDGRLERVVDPERRLLDLATNATGKMVLTKQTSDWETMDIILLNRAENRVVFLESNLPLEVGYPPLENMLVAKNGQHAVYSVRDGDSFRLISVPTSNPDERRSRGLGHAVGADQIPQLFEGPDADHFYLIDETGIYLFRYELDAEPRQLHAIDPKVTEEPWFFTALS